MAGDAPQSASAASLVKTFKCRACGADVTLRAAGHSLVATCSACGALVDVSDENYQVLAQYARKVRIEPVIPLGTRGELHGQPYEVIGYLRRTDQRGPTIWEEYLLFNPYQGFRWLHQYHGHWTYLLMTKSKPRVAGNTATYLNKSYRVFDRGSAQVAFVLGEFYWRVKVGDTVVTEDFVAPPEILSMERDDQEIVWSIGEYLPPEAVTAAFGLKTPLPSVIGVAPNQPSPIAPVWITIRTRLLQFVGALLVMQFLAASTAHDLTVDRETFASVADVKTRELHSFEVSGRGNLALDVRCSGLNNNWVDIDFELVNETTGDVRAANQTCEYYSGWDSDGSWVEDRTTRRTVLPAVPAGRYHLNIETTAGKPGPGFALAVKRGVVTWGNFFVAMGLLVFAPLLLWWRKQAFEMTRWSESDYSPYPHQRDDE